MPEVKEIVVYSFDELSDEAKERAREWWRKDALDYNWWEFIYGDASRMGTILGIDLNTKPVKLMNGSTRYDPCIFFSGFSSQGDGACYEGTYSYAKGAAKKIRKEAPKDTDLHEIADALQSIQHHHRYQLTAKMVHRGHYYHSGCMYIDVDGDAEELEQPLRDFADWIYRQLETEHDYQMSDESVDENIRANGYEFTEEGELA